MNKTNLSPQSLTKALHTEGCELRTLSKDRPDGGDGDPGDIRSKQNFDFDDDDDSDNALFL